MTLNISGYSKLIDNLYSDSYFEEGFYAEISKNTETKFDLNQLICVVLLF